MKRIFFTVFIGLMSMAVYSQEDITERIKTLYDNKEYETIIAEYADKVQDYPAKAIYYVGLAFYVKADDPKCLEMMELSIKKDSTDPDPFFIQGMTYNYMKKYSNAIVLFEKAIELNPNKSDYHSGMGDSYFNLNLLDKALDAYIKATKTENPIDRPFIMLPQVYAKKNDLRNALLYCYIAKDTISKDTDSYITVLYNIGLYELLNRNYEQAEIALKELIELSPSDYQSYSKLIQVYYGKKEYDKAEPYRQKLYDAHSKGILKDNLKYMFCFDQFDWNGKLIQAYESFEEKTDDIFYKHIFYVLNNENQVEFSIQTEFSPISIELGGNEYLLGMNKDHVHYTFGIGFNKDFKYDDLKKAVIDVLEGKVQPGSSSRAVQNK